MKPILEIMKEFNYDGMIKLKGTLGYSCPFAIDDSPIDGNYTCAELCGQIFPELDQSDGLGLDGTGPCPCDVLDKIYVAQIFWGLLDKAQC
jgi:hypothetical protein